MDIEQSLSFQKDIWLNHTIPGPPKEEEAPSPPEKQTAILLFSLPEYQKALL